MVREREKRYRKYGGYISYLALVIFFIKRFIENVIKKIMVLIFLIKEINIKINRCCNLEFFNRIKFF